MYFYRTVALLIVLWPSFKYPGYLECVSWRQFTESLPFVCAVERLRQWFPFTCAVLYIKRIHLHPPLLYTHTGLGFDSQVVKFAREFACILPRWGHIYLTGTSRCSTPVKQSKKLFSELEATDSSFKLRCMSSQTA